jgi:Holliday junction resolvase RusA-like endonuclease
VTDTIQVFVPGKPSGKARPRFGKGTVYADPKSKAREREISMLAKVAMMGRKPFTGPVRVNIHLWMHGNRTDKPDIDNAEKLILDAFNGIVWTDDKNVVEIHTTKHASREPSTVIHVEAA